MKKSLLFSVIACMATLLLFTSCKEENYDSDRLAVSPNTGSPDFIGEVKIFADSKSALFSVIVNPGFEWELKKEDGATWITNIDIQNDNKSAVVKASVTENTSGSQRRGVITVTAGNFTKTMTIIQQATNAPAQ